MKLRPSNTNKLVLRPYQQEALDAIDGTIAFGDSNIVLDATTSFGKTAIIAGICEQYPEDHIVVMVNIEPLIDQISETLTAMNIEHSIFKAGREKEFNKNARVNIVMSQTYYARAEKQEIEIFSKKLIIDERHREYATPRTSKLINDLQPETIIGLTGTPYDSDGFALHNAEVIQTISSQELTEQGYLSPLKFYAPKWAEKINYTKVKRSGSDYSMVSLDEVIGTPKHIAGIVKSMNQLNAKNKKTLIFSSTIEMCDKLEKALLDDGYNAAAYHSKKSKQENERIMKSFKHNLPYAGSDEEISGQTLFNSAEKKDDKVITHIVSVSKLNIGFSVNDIDLGVFVRKMGPRSLYVQSAGREKRKSNSLTELLEKHKENIQYA